MEILEIIKKWIRGNKISVLSLGIALLTIIGSVMYVSFNKCEECPKCEELSDQIELKNSNDSAAIQIEETEYKVDVKGAVNNPGVYTLKSNATVGDAIYLAGGPTYYGVTSNINLSKHVKDEMVIYVFTQYEIDNKTSKNEVVCEIPKCECEEVTVYKEVCTNPIESVIEETKEKNISQDDTAKDRESKISINTDSIEELTKLDGIGESKAKQIIEYRRENGDFKSIEDIKNVSGIGDKAYEKIKDSITV